jgi:hypothetical protein
MQPHRGTPFGSPVRCPAHAWRGSSAAAAGRADTPGFAPASSAHPAPLRRAGMPHHVRSANLSSSLPPLRGAHGTTVFAPVTVRASSNLSAAVRRSSGFVSVRPLLGGLVVARPFLRCLEQLGATLPGREISPDAAGPRPRRPGFARRGQRDRHPVDLPTCSTATTQHSVRRSPCGRADRGARPAPARPAAMAVPPVPRPPRSPPACRPRAAAAATARAQPRTHNRTSTPPPLLAPEAGDPRQRRHGHGFE